MNKKQAKQRWNQLLSDERFRTQTKFTQTKFDHRNPFEKDYSRLVFSSPFRRMQDKTQVYPLSDSDFVRTRLTHSIEVSTIARGLGMNLEKELLTRGFLADDKKGHIISLLSASTLVHDLGNPPFGHFGETVIQKFFQEYLKDISEHSNFRDRYSQTWTKEELSDLKYFDGNVQTFRILKKLQPFRTNDPNSFNLTFSTLASIIKYPFNSVDGNQTNQTNKLKSKFGFFQSEKDSFEKIWNSLELSSGSRHPLAYIVEAADDITYLACDVEDGCKKGIITIEILDEYVNKYLKKRNPLERWLINTINSHKKDVRRNRISNPLDIIARDLRIYSQGFMIDSVIKTFFDHHENIISRKCTFNENLLEISAAQKIKELLKELEKLVHRSREIFEMEIVGEKVLTGLLKPFVDASNSPERDNKRLIEGKLFELISPNYREIRKQFSHGSNSSYNNCQLVTDYISGMTDSYALSLYRKISGITL